MKLADKILFSDEREKLRKQRIVLLIGFIDDYDWLEEMFQDFEIIANSVEKGPINLFISSQGGNVTPGIACMREIGRIQKKGIDVIGNVHGSAMSMAFLVLQECNKRIMGESDILMVHGITSFTIGDLKNVKSEQKLLTFWQNYFAEFMANRVTVEKYKDKEFWLEIFCDNTPIFYDSKEALAMGLIDEIE